jgi:hypothetical protein
MSATLPEPLSLPWKLKPVSSAQSGSETLADGRTRFWVKEELKGITPAMLVWWFGHLEGDVEIKGRRLPRYRVMHPFDHVSVRYVRRAPDGSVGPGAQIAVCEFLGRNPHYEINRVATFEKLDEQGFVNNIVVGGLPLARLEHTFRQTPSGTHFEHFLIVPGNPRLGKLGAAVAGRLFPQAEGEAWLKHAIEEMGALEEFLPELYARETSAQDHNADFLRLDQRLSR